MEEVDNEWEMFKGRLLSPWRKLTRNLPSRADNKARELTALSAWTDDSRRHKWNYLSPRYKVDRTLTCPNSASYGCLDLWGPDLFAEFAGVCSHCGYHFPMEPEWYVKTSSIPARSLSSTAKSRRAIPWTFPVLPSASATPEKDRGQERLHDL
mgnify:CR=1 FL=1